MRTDILETEVETEVEKPDYNKLEGGVSASDAGRGTDDGDDVKLYVVKSRMRVTSQVEGTTEAAALGVRPCLNLAGVLELAMDLHSNRRTRKSPTLVVNEWQVA